MKMLLLGLAAAGFTTTHDTPPTPHRSPTSIAYTLRVVAADLGRFHVELRITRAPDTFSLAMARHPEYDDRYYRFVENLTIDRGTIARADSQVWRVSLPGGEGVVRYAIRLPPGEGFRGSWRPFLSPTGGLVGGPHSFMYVVGQESHPSTVTLELPQGWTAATALQAGAYPLPTTHNARSYDARSVDELVESPILVGNLRTWSFRANGIPHHIAWWPAPNATPFDTVAFTGAIERLTNATLAVFGGRAPYREFTFLVQDGSYGGLEHPSSVTMGTRSAQLAQSQTDMLEELGHEFFHTWNLMSIRPTSYRGVSHLAPEATAELWFSEGLSMFYSDLLNRRIGTALPESTRAQHLENLLARWLLNPASARFSAEALSRVAYNARPDALGDYDSGVHLPGEVAAAMLDLIVRDATDGRRSMDDVMKGMFESYGVRDYVGADLVSAQRGFTSTDVERVVERVCACDVTPFFDNHIRGAGTIDFARYLGLAGLELKLTRAPAIGRDGQPGPDLRIRAWTPPGESAPRLILSDPSSAWGRAGLHSGDVVRTWGGAPATDWQAMRQILGRLRIGDSLEVNGRSIVVTGYDRPVVRISPAANASAKARRIGEEWSVGAALRGRP